MNLPGRDRPNQGFPSRPPATPLHWIRPMTAYIVAQVTITDEVAFEDYRALAVPAVEKYDGTFLASSDDVVVLEGDPHAPRIVMVSFPSLARAREFYDSPEYQAAIAARQGAATMEILAVDGA